MAHRAQTAASPVWELWRHEGLLARTHECVHRRWNNWDKATSTRCIRRELRCARCATSLLKVGLPLSTFEYAREGYTFSAGWLLDPRALTVYAAFAHDASTGSNYKTRPACPGNLSASAYVKGRLAASPDCSTQASAFLASAYNCRLNSTERMMDMQRMYESRRPSRCGGSVNQVHVDYERRDIIGAFYARPTSKFHAMEASRQMGGIPILYLNHTAT